MNGEISSKIKKGERKMGFFKSSQKSTAESVYKVGVVPHLSEKDGFVHLVMINSFSKWLNQSFGCEDKYTNQIEEILVSMQKDGYEIIDVKFNSIAGQGLTGQMEGYHTLIIYK